MLIRLLEKSRSASRDHQATMGAFVGTVAVENGAGRMVDWSYKKGEDYLPSDAEVMKLRPASN